MAKNEAKPISGPTVYKCHHCDRAGLSMDEISCAKCDKDVAFHTGMKFGNVVQGAAVLHPGDDGYQRALDLVGGAESSAAGDAIPTGSTIKDETFP